MYMLRIGINGIHLRALIIDHAGDVFFNSFPVFFRDEGKTILGNKDKVSIQVVIFNFHR